MTHNIAVIVDAYSTGAKLAAKFHSEGVAVLHVQSASPIIDFYINDWRPERIQQQYEFESCRKKHLKKYLNVLDYPGFQWFSAGTKKDA
ncbi:hypothetical protein BLL37_08995 [Pseudomonas azotoformans]|uniref:Uncharacterized protein n=1 Tax=Pseudomonas azotoformans TaxID=47878 RepID=A0A1V2JNF9_PSEAZ|nr:hypothetical protein [Pseudomonas azotoformans]OIN47087.1 hypothetical protein BFL39_18330 [Pseudomonas azotoformans]ONH46988.1 hypothetical protein BLL37_08995 [Pseudomonas azotoformans]SDM82217.1 hypothetical protein SAMN04489799_0325 [Pseudomonas azotoformans]